MLKVSEQCFGEQLKLVTTGWSFISHENTIKTGVYKLGI